MGRLAERDGDTWISAEPSCDIKMDGGEQIMMTVVMEPQHDEGGGGMRKEKTSLELGFAERALSAAGAAVLSAVISILWTSPRLICKHRLPAFLTRILLAMLRVGWGFLDQTCCLRI
ncbi:hypothetical protein MLD38_025703 [Melastoma candidum]|uniref:Uncharacterized protein n=1 Tax=Melastoma candidum TaxID=119954 RepID=A0ACB9P340_9MYRT|nr:hypothetical protein MLD38_025703 [Melastoma candidum]